jgi:hypothetical protein
MARRLALLLLPAVLVARYGTGANETSTFTTDASGRLTW